MTATATAIGSGSFGATRSHADARVLRAFHSSTVRRALRAQSKLDLESLWTSIAAALATSPPPRPAAPLDVHQAIVDGLPGPAMFVSAAMAFDSMHEALPFFEVSAKTARAMAEGPLPAHQGEIALRIGRVLALAADVLGSLESARQYLRTRNFALGGAAPRDLLKTADGERIVLAELQAQGAGGPV